MKLKEAEERKQKRQENAKAYLARGSSHNLQKTSMQRAGSAIARQSE